MKQSWPVMGTFAEVILVAENGDGADKAIESVREIFNRINETMTVYEKSSDLMRVNRWAGHRALSVDPWVADLVRKARRAALLTDGAFSVDVLAEGIERGLKPPLVNAVPPGGHDGLISVMQTPPRIYLQSSSMALDLGGIAKGYALDRAAEAIEKHGYHRYLINLGRNIQAGKSPEGSRGWPVRASGSKTIYRLENEAVSVSNQSVQSDTKHIVGPREVSDPSDKKTTLVIAKKGWIADMASTALLVNPALKDDLKRYYPAITEMEVQNK